MKGRLACWFQVVGFQQLIRELQGCTSDRLQAMLTRMPQAERANLVRLQQQITENIVEELTDKLGFHNSVPYSAIRIYWGQIKGGSTVEARRFCGVCIAEYDDLIAKGLEFRVHRVSHLLFSKTTECRRQLEMFGAGLGNSLLDFPVAHRFIMMYALISPCGRRVEGEHAVIKRLGLVARNVSPPWISAALGEALHIQALDSDPDFFRFCVKRWRSQTVMDDLLHLIVPKSELKGMSTLEKIRRAYQCDTSSEFRDMTAEREAHLDNLQLTAATRSGGRKDMPKSWYQCVSWFKAKLKPNVVYSMPAVLWDKALVCPDVKDLNMETTDHLSSALTVLSEIIQTFDMDTVPDTVFFELVHAHPELRKAVPLHHLDDWGDTLRVSQRTVMGYDVESKRVVLTGATSTVKVLHLRVLVSDMLNSMKALFMWQSVVYGCAHGIRQHQLALGAPSEQPVILPRATDVLQQQLQQGGSVGVTVDRSLAIVRCMNDAESVTGCLGRLAELKSERHVEWIPYVWLGDINFELVSNLVEVGALAMRESEFFDLELKVVEGNVRHVSVQTNGDPVQLIQVDEYAQESKLDVILALLRRGWAHVGSVPPPYKRTREKHLIQHMRKPSSYYVCLLEADQLFARGVSEVKHDGKDLYYQALLRLDGERLAEFLRKLQAGVDSRWCRRALKDKTACPIAHAPPSEPGTDEEVEVLVLEDDPRHIPAVPSRLCNLEWKRVKVCNSAGIVVKVFFDHVTQENGRQRCWANCVTCEGHRNCFQWRSCEVFEDRSSLAAYQFTWATTKGHANRAAHMGLNVGQDAVDANIRSGLTIKEF